MDTSNHIVDQGARRPVQCPDSSFFRCAGHDDIALVHIHDNTGREGALERAFRAFHHYVQAVDLHLHPLRDDYG
jgi:hypothetical protein